MRMIKKSYMFKGREKDFLHFPYFLRVYYFRGKGKEMLRKNLAQYLIYG